ncbi:MAG: tRNA (adenosine(37)-N6)-dimethylallyltransferase MiaA [Oligoflexales bacterium]|nr:tRNA (adenosine(37)-N6)-dimethylallyltransferase MiaA [Oligoflexales bacterium]
MMSVNNPIPTMVIFGPTASGKSRLAMHLGKLLKTEIVVCDSVQLYKQFNIGSAKPSPEDQARIPHHMIDILDCSADYDAASYAEKARQNISEIVQRGALPVVVAGTGLYLRALLSQNYNRNLPQDLTLRQGLEKKSPQELYVQLKELDPQRAGELHVNDKYRVMRALELNIVTGQTCAQLFKQQDEKPVLQPLFGIYVNPDRGVLHSQIKNRCKEMLNNGLVQEVDDLLRNDCEETCKPMQSIGYLQVQNYLKGLYKDQEELLEKMTAATRQYAKRQCTWFKKLNYNFEINNQNEQTLLVLIAEIRKFYSSYREINI